ncbi:RecQ family ATP-dependent DNA helicase [Alkalicoccobacillus murimartini]|uniref:DNA 3'-5' helicase n=1 Tax=Alkalicoccobacillus murimartini TaxID=171685 RepID=A0ABT9YBN9_9BACI|nr:RecQ family ATP-dependent DNA helicase [Alkalicoccobacillus murimartini]MDQ0205232.1 ATP-dependent DNA helicase RecQ [Alkalicoccobacillus murimartini]
MYLKELEKVFGHGATYRNGQEKAIDRIVKGERVLVVQKTGWGKSLVYFLATKIIRERGDGVTLIISPLLALTRNQIESTEKYGLNAECINYQFNKSIKAKKEIINRCNTGDCDVLFITPEQLQNKGFVNLLSELKVGLFVVDEAHCISDWGHDFRPDYRRIKSLIDILPMNIPVLATTATANDRVVNDIVTQLGRCEVIRGDLQRDSLYLHKLELPTSKEKYAWIVKNLKNMNGSGIIYATTIKECERLAIWLRYNGFDAHAYHGNLKEEVKIDLENQLINNNLKVLVSTIALGMGFDKEDIEFVFHYYSPKSIVEHYQQIGRAGRNIEQAVCVLLYGGEDESKINEHFIYNSFPKEVHINLILDFLKENDGVKLSTIEGNVNINSSIINQIIKLLLIDGFIEKDSKNNYSCSLKLYNSQQNYYESVIEKKILEYNELLEFQRTEECQMMFLTRALNDSNSIRCGNCSTCLGRDWSFTEDNLTTNEIKNVSDFFEMNFIKIDPRMKTSKQGKLEYTYQVGLALSYYHEELGRLASDGKYRTGEFSNLLVKASADKLKRFLKEKNINIEKLVIVPIPSNRRPQLVPEFANRLATKLQCFYAHILAKRENEPEQKTLLNRTLQEQSIRDYLYIKEDIDLSNYHVLLVDDFVDSRWTFTVATELLCEKYDIITVTPFALADTSGSD